MTLPRRDDGITRNQLGEDTTSSLDAERERADINQNNVGKIWRTILLEELVPPLVGPLQIGSSNRDVRKTKKFVYELSYTFTIVSREGEEK